MFGCLRLIRAGFTRKIGRELESALGTDVEVIFNPGKARVAARETEQEDRDNEKKNQALHYWSVPYLFTSEINKLMSHRLGGSLNYYLKKCGAFSPINP